MRAVGGSTDSLAEVAREYFGIEGAGFQFSVNFSGPVVCATGFDNNVLNKRCMASLLPEGQSLFDAALDITGVGYSSLALEDYRNVD